MNPKKRDVVIIGAGHNGLVAAGYLARSGLDVEVLERRHLVGGACATEELFPGFHFSRCSFMLYALHPKIAHDMELSRHGFEIYRLEPHEFRPFPDGRHLIFWRDPDKNAEAIRAFSQRDAENYPRWNDFWERAQTVIQPYALRPPPTLTELVQRAQQTGNQDIFEKILTTSHADIIDEYFESEHVKGALIHSGDHGDPRAVRSAHPSAFLPGDVEPSSVMRKLSPHMVKPLRKRKLPVREGDET